MSRCMNAAAKIAAKQNKKALLCTCATSYVTLTDGTGVVHHRSGLR